MQLVIERLCFFFLFKIPVSLRIKSPFQGELSFEQFMEGGSYSEEHPSENCLWKYVWDIFSYKIKACI